jgi:putative holliday junction resolvase
MDRFLALDYGTKRIGVALTDPLKIIAQPLMALENTPQFFAQLQKILIEQKVSRIIIGNPIRLDGKPGPAEEAVAVFVTQLKAVTTLPVILWDERLTSAEANKRMIESGIRRERRKELVDALAAALLLKNYLQATGGK